MYSREVEALLRKKGITPGDMIRVVLNKKTFEGILLPRPEFGDQGALVLKLKNGYNIGLKPGVGTKLEKLEHAKETFTFPRVKLEKREGLPNVTIVSTGGTIESKVDYITGGVHMLVEPEEMLAQVPEILEIANFKVVSPMRIASEDMLYQNWQEIARAVAKALSDSHGVIVTHGTDTMHYTAAALSFMLDGLTGPVVITGAQRSVDRGSSDAFMNLLCSAHLAAKGNVAEVGICMHASSSDGFCNFIRGTKVRKMHTTKRDAFRPINNRPIARISPNGAIDYIDDERRRRGEDRKLRVVAGYEPRVALLKFYPNSDPDIIDYYIGKGYKGIIIEGTGMGHVAVSPADEKYSWLGHIKRAVESGMVVGVTSQCLNGRVNGNVYRNLRLISGTGAIYCEDMMPETALVKLGWLLGNHKRGDAARMLSKNIAGEITERTEIDFF
ncbi:MAG: Glu-tRNA(Gln) amidotransferase subunit GatD [Candidatus Micrarchaeota archaeon]|nr:Glu-tRNA(Gln) amidotransferase subunit GatD [Candidatus Micrarchaeota archaeon]